MTVIMMVVRGYIIMACAARKRTMVFIQPTDFKLVQTVRMHLSAHIQEHITSADQHSRHDSQAPNWL